MLSKDEQSIVDRLRYAMGYCSVTLGKDEVHIPMNDMEILSLYRDTGLTPTDIATLRNFACNLCGRYKMAHEGACNGCRWHRKGE